VVLCIEFALFSTIYRCSRIKLTLYNVGWHTFYSVWKKAGIPTTPADRRRMQEEVRRVELSPEELQFIREERQKALFRTGEFISQRTPVEL